MPHSYLLRKHRKSKIVHHVIPHNKHNKPKEKGKIKVDHILAKEKDSKIELENLRTKSKYSLMSLR